VRAGRHYKIMEVCGGHTHTIYRYGVQDHLPDSVELVHGRAARSAWIPMGRGDDGIAIARRDGVILTCFGDMMRVPGGEGSFLDANAAARTSGWSTRRWTRCGSPGNTGPRSGFLRDRLRDDRAVDRADRAEGQAEGITNFSVFCNHVTIIPAIKAFSTRPTCGWTRSSARATCRR